MSRLLSRIARFAAAALLLAAGALLTVEAQQPAAPVNLGQVRVVNGLVGLGPVDVYVNGARVAFNLPPEIAMPYLSLPAGQHTLAVRRPDSDPLAVPIADALLTLAPNQSRTAVVYQKTFASGGFTPPADQVGALFVLDDDRSPIELGRTRLTAVHLATGTPQRLSIAYPSRASLLHEIALEKPFGSIDVDARTYSPVIVNADSPALDVLARLGDQAFYSSTLYTFVIVPDVQPSGTQPFTVGPVSPTPRAFIVSAPIDPPADGLRLRIIHAAHDTAVLDIYIDGRLVAERVNWSRATEYLGLKDYSHVITLRRTPSTPDQPPLAQAEFTITAENRSQKQWTLLLLNAGDEADLGLPVLSPGDTAQSARQTIINTPGGAMFMALLPDNTAQTRQGYARVRLVNAVGGAPPMRIFAPVVPPLPPPPGVTPSPVPTLNPNVPTPTPLPPQQVVEDTRFAAEASESEVPAGVYPALDFIPSGSLNPLVTLDSRQLVSGMVYTYVIMGSPVGDPPLRVITFADYGVGLPSERLYVGEITTESANIRANPLPDARVVARLPRGTEVEVLGRSLNGEWIRIRFTDALTGRPAEGWISGTANIIRVTRLGVPVNRLALPQYIAP